MTRYSHRTPRASNNALSMSTWSAAGTVDLTSLMSPTPICDPDEATSVEMDQLRALIEAPAVHSVIAEIAARTAHGADI